MQVNRIKGTRDIMPEQINKWRYVEEKFREYAERYGFKEIRTPVFEYTELFVRGVGETTDIVQKEMYTFEDMGKRSLTLRPEGTASVVRAYMENKEYAEMQPTKYFYDISCYRHEKPQADRLREFHQFGVEIFGAKSMMADVQVIALANDFLDSMGVKNLELRINSVGCPECRAKYKEALRDYFRPHLDELCDTCKTRFEKNPMRIIDCKSPEDKKIALGAPSILDYLCDDCRDAFEGLKENLDTYGIKYVVDPTIVRGLDYYTKTAFEFVTENSDGEITVCGGGRYDNLIKEIGAQDIPGVGFGMGIERLLSLMENSGVDFPEEKPMDGLIITMGDEAKKRGLNLTKELRDKGLAIDMDALERNMKGQLKYADKRGYRFAVIIGDNELAENKCQLRNLKESSQEEISIESLADRIKGE